MCRKSHLRTAIPVLLIIFTSFFATNGIAQNGKAPCGLVAQISTEFVVNGALLSCYISKHPIVCALAIELNSAASRQITTTVIYGSCKITTWVVDGTVTALIEAVGKDAKKITQEISNEIKSLSPKDLHHYLINH